MSESKVSKIKRSLAIVIGINEYTHIPKLKNAVSDAVGLAGVLKDIYGYKVLLLLNQRATKAELNKLVANLQNKTIPFDKELIKVDKSDRVLFYFAGHGFAVEAQDSEAGKPAGYFMPQDADVDNKNTWLSMHEVYQTLSNLDCHHLLMILDCCFAGRISWIGQGRNTPRSRKLYHQSYDRFIKHRTEQIITSAAYDEEAQDLSRFGQRGEKNGNSPFAHLLLKVLQGNSDGGRDKFIEAIVEDKIITVHELFVYLQYELGKVAAGQTPGLAQPRKYDRETGEYVYLKGEYIFPLPEFKPEELEKLKLNKNTNPYKGFASFETEDTQLFFGRKILSQQLGKIVTEQPLTVVLGASGSGKSSLVKAGLIPILTENWQILPPMRPGESPFKALNKILTQSESGSSIISRTPQEKINILSGKISYLITRHSKSKLLLVIDQSEELLTLCKSQQEREDFLNLLAELLTKYPQQLHIVLTLRSDFEPQLRDAIKEIYWQQAWQEGRFFVTPMDREELQQAIEEPAAQRTLFFESPKLVNQLIDEAINTPGALPLLSFTLSELYLKYLQAEENRERDDRTITEADYEQLGGVARSSTQAADKTYRFLVKKEKIDPSIIRNVMLRMVAVSGGELARRRVPMKELEYPESINEQVKIVIDRFVEARLLTTGLDTEGQEYLEPVHDALVTGWTKIKYWLEEREGQSLKVNLPFQRELSSAANRWESNKSAQYLWNSDSRINLSKQLLSKDDNWFNQIETEFVIRSIRQRNPIRRLTGILDGWGQSSQSDNSNIVSQKTTSSPDDELESENIEVVEEKKEFEKIDEEEDLEDINLDLLSIEDFHFIAQSFKNDLAQGPDLINIENEVHSLAEVLVMRDLQPPLAVGICGGWGSGKSYAMHLIQKKITEIRCRSLRKTQAWWRNNSDKDRLSLYVGHIYQIRFDAWTFAKVNLWSSLMQTIFYEFNRQLTLEKQLEEIGVDPLKGGDIWKALDEMSDEEREVLLNSELSSDKFKQWKDKASETNTVDWLWDTLTELRQEEKKNLKRSEDELSRKRLELQKKLEDIEHDVKQEIDIEASKAYWEPLREELKGIMGIAFTNFINRTEQELKSTAKSEQELEAKLLEVTLDDFQPTTWDNLYQVIRSNRKTSLAFIFFLMLTIATPFLLEILIDLNEAGWKLLLTLIPLTPSLSSAKQLWKETIKLQRWLDQTVKKYQQKTINKQQKLQNSFASRVKRKREEKELVNIEREIKKLEAQVERQRLRIGLTARYISLSDFIDTRLEENFYGKKLGFMQQVQRDLIDLTAHFVVPKESNAHKVFFDEKKERLKKFFPRGPARVVLYIDDLDRCPPNRVVEVLEAVQLLLKTPLFVVVLAIDDRYIARALEKAYQGILKRGGKPSGIDYMEKIIQVSYRMRPIPKSAIDNYLMSHMDIEELKQQEEPEESSQTPVIPSATDFSPPEEELEESSQTPVIPSATNFSPPEEEPEESSQTPVIPSATDFSPPEEELEESLQTPVIPSATDFSPPEEELEESLQTPVIPSATDFSQDENKDQTSSISDNKPRDLPLRVKKITHEEFNILRYCCKQVDLSPRTVKRLINIYKILKIIWFREGNFGKNEVELHIKQTIIACLALSGRYPHLMRNVFAELDLHFEEARDLDKKLVGIFLKNPGIGRDAYLRREWKKFCHDVKQLIPADLTLEGIELRNFHLLLSFSFVGDLGYDPDDFRPTIDKSDEYQTSELEYDNL